jgi:hypothetical protein
VDFCGAGGRWSKDERGRIVLYRRPFFPQERTFHAAVRMSGMGQSLQIVARRELIHVCNAPDSDQILPRSGMSRCAINVRFASRRTAAKFASLFDEAGGVVRDMTEIDLTGEHA